MPRASRWLLFLLVAMALGALLLAASVGSGPAGFHTLAGMATGRADPAEVEIILRLRLVRALAAFGTGACLGLAGVFMQVLLRNPLADPYILGTSGGAAAAALGMMLLGGSGLLVDGSAFAGALASTVLVFALAGGTARGGPGLLLTGIVVAAGWGALVSLLLALSPDTSLRGILFWLMGDFSFAETPWPTLAVAAGGTVLGLGLARSLDVLATGDTQAALLGLEVARTRLLLYIGAALLTAMAVTTAGIVGFVGLVIPHLVRLSGGSAHRTVVPGAMLAGGALLVLADTVARTALAPRQLPVGALTAAVGVPVFLMLLRREARANRA